MAGHWQCKGLISAWLLALAGPAFAGAEYDTAPVVDVEPIYKRVPVAAEERCHLETVYREVAPAHGPRVLTGAVVGGALGHALGHGKRNRRAAALVGAALGAGIAHGIAMEAVPRRVAKVREEVCEVVAPAALREEVASYLVTYRYRGKTHRARMAEHPGSTIRVRVSVAPATAGR